MASASAPMMTDKPPTYNEATGTLNVPAGAVPGYGATGYGSQGEPPAGMVKPQTAGAYPGADLYVESLVKKSIKYLHCKYNLVNE